MPLFRVKVVGFYDESFYVVANGMDEASEKIVFAIKDSGKRNPTVISVNVIGVENRGIFTDHARRLDSTPSDY